MTRRITALLATVLMLFVLVGCKSKDVPSSSTSVAPSSSEATTIDWEEKLRNKIKTATLEPDTNAIVCLDQSGDVYKQFHIAKEEIVDVPEQQGYRFTGYKNSDDVQYIDERGRVVKEYIGNDLLYLKAEFVPEEFAVRFFQQNGEPEDDKSKLECLYTSNILEDLRLGRTITDSSGEKLCVIGYADENGNTVINGNKTPIKIEELGDCVNYTDKTVDLYDIVTPIYRHYERLNTYEISDAGILKQSLDSRGTEKDEFEIEKEIDAIALKSVGYKYAEITIACEISANGGTQYIQVLNAWPEEKKRD